MDLQRGARHHRRRRLRAGALEEVPRRGTDRAGGDRDRRYEEHRPVAPPRHRDPRPRRGDRHAHAAHPHPSRAHRELGARTGTKRPLGAEGRLIARALAAARNWIPGSRALSPPDWANRGLIQQFAASPGVFRTRRSRVPHRPWTATSRLRGLEDLDGGSGDRRLAAYDADARDVEVRELLRDPLSGELVGRLRLLAVVEQADGHDHVVAGVDGVIGDEPTFLRQRLGEVAVNTAHDGVDRARSDAVGPQAGIHPRTPLDRAERDPRYARGVRATRALTNPRSGARPAGAAPAAKQAPWRSRSPP